MDSPHFDCSDLEISLMEDIGKSLDDDLYSRQLYIFHKENMKTLQTSKVLIWGCSGVGAEIAKNLLLSGVNFVAFLDVKLVELEDLGSNFTFSSTDIGKFRSEVAVQNLKELNSTSQISSITKDPANINEFLKDYDVCVISEAVEIPNLIEICDYCHSSQIPLIIAESYGFYGRVFCDFGPNFVIQDPSGADPTPILVNNLTLDENGTVQILSDDQSPFSVDDTLQFISDLRNLDSDHPTRKIESVISADTFGIGDTRELDVPHSQGYVRLVNNPITIDFQSFQESMRSPKFQTVDYHGPDSDLDIHILFLTINEALQTTSIQSLQNEIVHSTTTVDTLISIATKFSSLLQHPINDKDKFLAMVKGFFGSIPPLISLIGGYAAQEVLKACTSKFVPPQKFMVISARDISIKLDDHVPCSSIYSSQTRLIGQANQQTLHSMKLFLVGAGAIGCEVLKNLALMGVGLHNSGGKVYLADMDSIEKSNLSRQFLYRNEDIGQPKCLIAKTAISKINPDISVQHFTSEVSEKNEHVFSDQLLSQCDMGIMALDNVEARKYFSDRCVETMLPYLDTGTRGTQGSFDMFYPSRTLTYNCNEPPITKEIPMCTLKFFPYETTHAILWGRDLFETCFELAPMNLITLLEEESQIDIVTTPEVGELFELLTSCCSCGSDVTLEILTWAKTKWIKLFHDSVIQIINTYPEHHVVEGERFWKGHKKFPVPLKIDTRHKDTLQFIISSAKLISAVICHDLEEHLIIRSLKTMINQETNDFVPTTKLLNTKANLEATTAQPTQYIIKWDTFIQFKNTLLLSDFKICPLQFQKDIDSNSHVDFIKSAANNRAKNYQLPSTTKLEAKRIAGNIIPAIASTTSVIAGLACLQLYRLILRPNPDFKSFRRGNINLALPYCEMMLPDDPILKPSYNDTIKSAWDKLIVSEQKFGTVMDMIKHLEATENMKISTLSCKNRLIYAFGRAMSDPDNRMTLRQVLQTVLGETFQTSKLWVVIHARYVGMKGGDFMPPIHYVLHHAENVS